MKKMEYRNAKNPAWVNAEKTMLSLDVDFEEIEENGVYVNHVTAAWVDTAHGLELYQRAMNGDFGEISEFTPVSEEEKEKETNRIELTWIEEEIQKITPIIDDYHREQALPLELRSAAKARNASASYQAACEKYVQLRDYKESGQLHPDYRPF